MTDENKVAEALCKGVKEGLVTSKTRSGLCWWERALWVLFSGVAAVASVLLTGCAASISKKPDGSFDASVIIVAPGK